MVTVGYDCRLGVGAMRWVRMGTGEGGGECWSEAGEKRKRRYEEGGCAEAREVEGGGCDSEREVGEKSGLRGRVSGRGGGRGAGGEVLVEARSGRSGMGWR
jgi:hypothetical protein